MNVISRGVRNAFRNTVRTVGVVLILGLSIGLALSMLIARGAVDAKIKSVKSSIGNTVTISPAGASGFEGGGEPLTNAQVAKAAAVSHVTSVVASLRDRLTIDDTNLVSAIEAGTLGRRFNRRSGGQSGGTSGSAGNGATPAANASFTPPLGLFGVGSLNGAVLDGGNTLTLSSGSKFDPTKDQNVALIGKSLATKNNLAVGGTFKAYGNDITVVGIYDAGTQFANNNVVMPLSTVQRLSSQTDTVTSAVATIDDVSNVTAAVSAIKTAVGSDTIDVTSSQDATQTALSPLENIKTISTYSLIGALGAGAVIILLTMMMIVRERRREIGVLKAIGASNIKVMGQFMAESVTFTLLAAIIGLGFGVAAGGPITNLLVANSTSTTQTTGQTSGGGGGNGGGFGGGFARAGRGAGQAFGRAASVGGQSLRQLQATAGWDTLLAGLGAALFIALVGSAIPALLIAKVSPAEVMRAE